MTDYGTESIEIQNGSKKNPSTTCCSPVLTKKFVYCSSALFAVLFLTIYLFYGHFIQNDGSPLAQIKARIAPKASSTSNALTLATSQIENCDDGTSCDNKYGCISYEDDIEGVITDITKGWDEYAQYIEDVTNE